MKRLSRKRSATSITSSSSDLQQQNQNPNGGGGSKQSRISSFFFKKPPVSTTEQHDKPPPSSTKNKVFTSIKEAVQQKDQKRAAAAAAAAAANAKAGQLISSCEPPDAAAENSCQPCDDASSATTPAAAEALPSDVKQDVPSSSQTNCDASNDVIGASDDDAIDAKKLFDDDDDVFEDSMADVRKNEAVSSGGAAVDEDDKVLSSAAAVSKKRKLESVAEEVVDDDPFGDSSFVFDNSSCEGGTGLLMHSSVIEEPSPSKKASKNPATTTLSASKHKENRRESKKKSAFDYGRHVVTKVNMDKVYEMVLDLDKDPLTGGCSYKQCVLRGSWINTRVVAGDVINILCSNSDDVISSEVITVDDKSDVLVVVNPDVLVSGTSIMSSMFCMRKAVLSEYFKSYSGGSRVMFVGTLVHELLQNCLTSPDCTTLDRIREKMEECLRSPDLQSGMINLGIFKEDEIRREIEPFLPHILYFIQKYVQDKNVPIPAAAYAAGSRNSSSSNRGEPVSSWPGRVLEVEDVEENIWSAKLGVKGKVDLTIRVQLKPEGKEGGGKALSSTTREKGGGARVVPLELKTGRPSGSAEHRGQVILYSMMMSDRQKSHRQKSDSAPESGLLLYLRNSAVIEVKAGLPEQRGLVQLRNELVSNLLQSNDVTGISDIESIDDVTGSQMPFVLPEPINMKRACAQCELLPVCATYQKLSQSAAAPQTFREELVPGAIGHLTGEQLEFYRDHSTNCLLETGEVRKASKLKLLWQELPSAREFRKMALCDMVLVDVLEASSIHVFAKAKFKGQQQPLSTSVLHVGETVIVSTDSGLLAVAQGQVKAVTNQNIHVELDRALKKKKAASSCEDEEEEEDVYHLDRYEYNLTSPFSSNSSNLVNLAKLMLDNPQAAMLRDLIIGRKPAGFSKTLNREFAAVAKHILRPLNTVQQKAVFKTLMAHDYVLLEGMPGTGKTTVIVAFIRLCMVLGKSVLLTAYTHSALDNVLIKLTNTAKAGEKSLDFLRVANKLSRVHPSLRHATFQSKLQSGSSSQNMSASQVYDSIQGVPLVATTCLGVNHPAITQRKDKFDYCIVDEAGQSLMLAAIGPLFHSQKFVLVGDPHQLPPVVTSRLAKSRGMDKSLFSHLAVYSDEPNSCNVVPLTMQYRMNRPIQDLANHLTYNNQLVCGNETVANQRIGGFRSQCGSFPDNSWKAKFCDENCSVVFIDTSSKTSADETMTKEESAADTGIRNRGEAAIVKALCQLATSFQPNQQQQDEPGAVAEQRIAKKKKISVGVMAPYRAQVNFLTKALADFRPGNDPDDKDGGLVVDVNTVDQFQGSDRDIVIYSCTRTKKIGGADRVAKQDCILSDERRLNVAITRAKSKLVMIGNADALKTYAPFAKTLSYMEKNEMVVNLDTATLDENLLDNSAIIAQ